MKASLRSKASVDNAGWHLFMLVDKQNSITFGYG
jgi:hypothetical protein